MSRMGVRYDEVVAAADTIVAAGDRPTIRRIRDILKKGSDSTIHKHLTAWREKYDLQTTATTELPGYLLSVLKQFEDRLRADERATYESRLVTAVTDADDLASQLEVTEETLAASEQELSALRTQYMSVSAKSAEQAAELVQLNKDLDRALNAIELARTETAKTSSMVAVREEKISELVQANDKLRAALEAANQALIASDKGLAVTNAKLDAALEKSQLLFQDKERLSGQLGAALDSATAARVELVKGRGREMQTMGLAGAE